MPESAIAAPRLSTDDQDCMVVVPCYNEQARLPVRAFLDFLAIRDGIRFLFVNDGSSDGTLALLEQLRAAAPDRIVVMDQQPNAGKAEAVRRGMLHATALENVTYTGFWDADLATPLEEIPKLLSKLQRHPNIEMVFGARVRLLGRAIHRKPARHYLGRVFATVVSLLLQLPVYDTQCGAKLFRITPTLRQILATPFQSRWIFDVEILARFIAIHQRNMPYVCGAIYEYPLRRWEDVGGSKVQTSDFFRAFAELLKVRSTYLR